MVICFGLAIAQIAQSGLSSFKVIDYPALLFRMYEIYRAFTDSIKPSYRRGRSVQLSGFLRNLTRYNHHWTMNQAAVWMQLIPAIFRSFAEYDNGDQDYFLMSMGRAMGGR
ncbi:hypothetical protein [Erwinia tracheiphila]|uniref:hypothetical protein n=1 Tax=Erwinia tracheiphila TaxID=65700 RepID=UPI00128D43FE|nr:hypothetical protein [Erwinia tracheiphila]